MADQPLHASIDDGKKQATRKSGKKIKEITASFGCALGELAHLKATASKHPADKQKFAELSISIPEGVEISWARKNKLILRREK